MPTEVHDEAHGPPTEPNGGGSDPSGVASIPGATPDKLRPLVVDVLRELGVISDHTPGQPISPVDVAVTGDVDEDEHPRSITHPVITRGEQLQLALKQESNRGRTITILLGLLGLVLTGAVIACLRLPAEQGVERLNTLSNTLLATVAVAMVYYFRKSA